MARVNYQRDKRQRDLARQRKQEEKRQKKAQKGSNPDLPLEGADVETAEATDAPAEAEGASEEP